MTHLLDAHRELHEVAADKELYCFVDEIQNSPKWSKWVRRVTDQNPLLRVVVTGSSAKLLGTEMAAELRGRARTVTLFETHLPSPKVRNQLLYPRKIYGIDQGLLNAIRYSASEDRGRILENMVFLELRRRGHTPCYFAGKGECDFILREGVRAKTAIQACYRLGAEKTRTREIGSLVEAMGALGCGEGLILTDDEHEDVKAGKTRIAVRPFWLWALGAAESD